MNDNDDTPFTLHRGTAPLLVSVPHAGTQFPPALHPRYTERALRAEDTDWFLDRLYSFAPELGASFIVPRFSRYVVDLNRPGDDTPMYPGRNNTGLTPRRHFTDEPIYRTGAEPDAADVQRRVAAYWQPYHAAIDAELARIKAEHGHVVLFDGHSIKSELPWLFDGTLPHMNIGTVDGASCAPSLRAAVKAVFAGQQRYSWVIDGRFKGGHITRHFGRPQHGVHTVQLEMCWRAYMDEDPPRWNDARVAEVTPLLRTLLQTMLAWKAQ